MVPEISGRFADRTRAMRVVVAALAVGLMALLPRALCCWDEGASSLVFMMASFLLRMTKEAMEGDAIGVKVAAIDDCVSHMSASLWAVRVMEETVSLSSFKPSEGWVEVGADGGDDAETG